MKAIVIARPGGPEVLVPEDRPIPEPGPGEIRVRVHASALNRADLLQRRGSYPAPPGAPADVPGLEYAGEVDAVGEGAGLWAVGNRVMGIVAAPAHDPHHPAPDRPEPGPLADRVHLARVLQPRHVGGGWKIGRASCRERV